MAEESGVEAKNVAGAITSMGIDELIFNMAKGIADGQARLDETCMALAVQMGDAQIEFGKIPGTDEPDLISLIELGFTPNFYQFVDTILEVRVSVSSQYEEEQETSRTEVDQQIDERAQQQAYSNQRSNSSSGSGYSGGYSVGWGWRGYGVGWGGSGYNYNNSSSSKSQGASSAKSKAVKVNTVDATFSSKYAYSVEGSSLIKTKIVPVPPPQVFEEAVRSKAKERKEWAKRFALLRFSKHLLPAISDSGIKAKDAMFLFIDADKVNDKLTDFSYVAADEFKISVESMNEEYQKLTNDHWAVIEKVEDRRLMDNIFERLSNISQSVFDFFDENKVLKAGADIETELEGVLQATCDDFDKLTTKIDEIMARLPLTPEELAKEEENNAAA